MTAQVRVTVPSAWRTLLDEDRSTPLTCRADTVAEVLEWMVTRYPMWAPRLLPDGRIPCWINVFVDGDNIRDLSGVDTAIQGEVELVVLPALAGG